MTTASARLLVLVGEHFACVRIVGRANFNSSIDFRTLINELTQKGYRYFMLDLSECALMDSTFLGVIAGFGLKLSVGQADPCKSGIELLNPNARIVELLEHLGILHLFKLTRGPQAAASCPEPAEPARSEPSKSEVTRACIEAHQNLMEINPANVAKFKEVSQFLAEDLKRLREQSSQLEQALLTIGVDKKEALSTPKCLLGPDSNATSDSKLVSDDRGTPTVPDREIDNVHFSVTSPCSASPGSSFILDVWAHRADQRQAVINRAREAMASRELVIQSKGPVPIVPITTKPFRKDIGGADQNQVMKGRGVRDNQAHSGPRRRSKF